MYHTHDYRTVAMCSCREPTEGFCCKSPRTKWSSAYQQLVRVIVYSTKYIAQCSLDLLVCQLLAGGSSFSATRRGTD